MIFKSHEIWDNIELTLNQQIKLSLFNSNDIRIIDYKVREWFWIINNNSIKVGVELYS